MFKHATLSNGLEIIAEVDPGAHTAAAGFFVKAGARDEASEVMGVSHFLEHMMFKGSTKRSAEQVDLDFDNLGANHNAFTTSEMTAFYAHTLPEHLAPATEILADIMRPALRQEDFDDEKSVILEEIAMYADQPFWVLYERTMEEYYATHPLRHRVLGTKDTINAMTRDQMQAYFDHRYSADNTILSLAGRMDFEAMVAQVEQLCSGWGTTNATRDHAAMSVKAHEFTMQLPSVNRHYAIMLSDGPATQDDRRYAASILANVLGDADGSRLYWAIVDPGLADEAQVSYHGRDGLGELIVYYSCDPDKAEQVEQVIDEQIASVVDSLTEDDLQRQRSKIATAATLHGERPAGRMRRLGQLWTYDGEYRPLEEDLRRINAVTIEDVRNVFNAYPFTPRVTGRLRPE